VALLVTISLFKAFSQSKIESHAHLAG
jgi:hypothetical protein